MLHGGFSLKSISSVVGLGPFDLPGDSDRRVGGYKWWGGGGGKRLENRQNGLRVGYIRLLINRESAISLTGAV